MWRILFVLCVPILTTLSTPITDAKFEETMGYLQRYGYLRENSPSLHEFREGLKTFQEVAGLESTGEIDEQTLEAIGRPRCSHEDVHRTGGSRARRFALASLSKWDQKHFKGNDLYLKWHISKYTTDIPKSIVRNTVQKAFALWAAQSNLRMTPQVAKKGKVTMKFEEVSSTAESDINILWAEGEHGDQHTFDGNQNKDNILAHTFFPSHSAPLNGDIHFDDSEQWEINVAEVQTTATNPPNNKRFFPYVLAHEIGHALGLQHSKKSEAVMNPFYRNIPLEELTLDIDDKCGINWNYAGPSEFCLFVWLMSEIVPIHNNPNLLINHNHVMRSDQKLTETKKVLKDMRIPRCLASNELQDFIERRLRKSLQFSPEDAKKFSDTSCNFLVGLHMYRGSPNFTGNDSAEKEYHAVKKEVSEFAPASLNLIKRMTRTAEERLLNKQPSIFDPAYFNDAFFDEFLASYLNFA